MATSIQLYQMRRWQRENPERQRANKARWLRERLETRTYQCADSHHDDCACIRDDGSPCLCECHRGE